MCARYCFEEGPDAEEIQRIIDAVNRYSVPDQLKAFGEIFPADTVPVIAGSKTMEPSAFAMTWGYSLPDGKRIINARSESAGEKAMFREGMVMHRCAVPASHYFEWGHTGKQKTKYAIRPAYSGLMYMAGIYRMEKGRPVFAILTRIPEENIAFIHNRMPVILFPEMVRDWVNPKYAAGDLLRHAAPAVQYRKTGPDAPVQISMDLSF